LFDKLHQFGVVPNAARPAIFGSSMFFMAMSIYTPGIDNNKSITNLLIILFGISYIWAAFVNTYWEIEIE
jgi:hypothetical protein